MAETILIGADFVPTESNRDLFVSDDLHSLLGDELIKRLQDASFRIFNLEVPLTDAPTPIDKNGPNLIAPVSAVQTFQKVSVNLFTVANNHIMDQGEAGLRSTLATLQQCGIDYVGAGEDAENAKKPFFFSFAGKKVGVYACAEHEFSFAAQDRFGANPFDPLFSLDHIENAKRQCDYLIVLYHGGKEHYRYPSPDLRKVCRRCVDKGANLVVTQHSHCIGCREDYHGGTIVYGQGNFLFDEENNEYWNTSLLLMIDGSFRVSEIPLVKYGNGVRLAEGAEGENVLAAYKERSRQIEDETFVEREYAIFAEKSRVNYLAAFSGKESLLFKILNKLSGNKLRTWKINRKFGKRQLLALWNYIECEAHRELILRGIRISNQ